MQSVILATQIAAHAAAAAAHAVAAAAVSSSNGDGPTKCNHPTSDSSGNGSNFAVANAIAMATGAAVAAAAAASTVINAAGKNFGMDLNATYNSSNHYASGLWFNNNSSFDLLSVSYGLGIIIIYLNNFFLILFILHNSK